MGSQVERTHSKVAARGLARARRGLVDREVPHSCADKPGGKTGERDRSHNPWFKHGEIKPPKL